MTLKLMSSPRFVQLPQSDAAAAGFFAGSAKRQQKAPESASFVAVGLPALQEPGSWASCASHRSSQSM